MPPPPKTTKKIPSWLGVLVICFAGIITAFLIDYQPNYLIYGTFCNPCEEHQNTFYLFEDGGILVDTTESFCRQMETVSSFEFYGYPVSEATRYRLMDYSSTIPALLFLHPSNARAEIKDFPCGFYLQFEKWGIRKEMVWSPTNPPFFLTSFTAELLEAEKSIMSETKRVSGYRLGK